MAKHRTHSIAFKRQVVQEYLAGETLHGLARRRPLREWLIDKLQHVSVIAKHDNWKRPRDDCFVIVRPSADVARRLVDYWKTTIR